MSSPEANEIVEAEVVPFFADRQKVYPRKVKGTVRRIKWAVLSFCLAVYYLLPWLRWDRGFGRPDQAVLVDMTNRRLYFFWIEIWPQEIYYLAGAMILAAVGLFFVTSLFGRLWCGYACPQTVWTDLFMWAERLIEGDRGQRIRLDQAPLSLDKIWRKGAKHAVWLTIAIATGGAWIMYFNDAPTVMRAVFTGEADAGVYGFIGLFTATTYLLAGWAREQVCTYMCPWPRFQAAMVDEHTLTVTYRSWRGEARGKHRKGESWEGRGDCVDCKACVAVCPTGIDIRDGLQLECIGCGLCIDACNEIMDKVDRPRGLIAFDTPVNQEKGHVRPPRLSILRPRTVLYALVLVLASGIMLTAFAMRSTLDISVLPDRNPLFVTLSDGSIRNGYTLKISNKDPIERHFHVTFSGLDGARVAIAGSDAPEAPAARGLTLTVAGDTVGTFKAYVHAERSAARGEVPLIVSIRADDGTVAATASHFHGPTTP